MPQEKWHGCAPGMTSFTITADCELMPCRRLEENFGSILDKSIEDIRQENKRALLQILKLPDECKQCKYHKICHGGAKCITHAVYNTYNKPDPNCLFLKSNESDCDGCNGCAV